jgi:hypothetical protein
MSSREGRRRHGTRLLRNRYTIGLRDRMFNIPVIK